MISCKEATHWISLKEEGKLSYTKTIKLKTHLAICILCKRFEIQTRYFTKLSTHLHKENVVNLSIEKKIELKKKISELTR
jgi:hypothetical protein